MIFETFDGVVFGPAHFQVRPVVCFVVFRGLDWIAEIVRQRVHVYSRHRLFFSGTRLTLEFLFFFCPFYWIIRTMGAFVCSFLKQRDGFSGEEFLMAFCKISESRCALFRWPWRIWQDTFLNCFYVASLVVDKLPRVNVQLLCDLLRLHVLSAKPPYLA